MHLTFDNVYWITTYALRFNSAHPNLQHDRKWMAKLIFFNTVSCICFYLLANSIIFHDTRNGKYSEAIRNGAMLIVAITIIIKYFVLLRHQNTIASLIQIIDKDYSNTEQLSEDEQQIILDYSRRGVNVCKFWFVSASSTGAIFPLKALFFMIRSYCRGEFELVLMFDLTYPKLIEAYKNSIYGFLLVFSLCFIFDIYASTMYVGFDPLVSIFLLHVCGQIDILSKRIKDVMVVNIKENDILENLKKINQKLQALYTFVKELESTFMALFEFNMKTTTFLIPFAAFQIVQSLQNLELNMEFICFFSASILHFFMPCYYSNCLMERGKNLQEAIYSSGWEHQPNIQIRKTILFMLTRCSTPLTIRTIFYPVNLQTFAEMCRQAYAIFNIMNAAWT